MPDGLPPLRLPELPATVARPARRATVDEPWKARAAWLVLAAHLVGLLVVDRALRLRESPPRAAPGESFIEVRFLAPEPAQSTPSPASTTVAAPGAVGAPPRPRPTAAPPTRADGMQARFLPATPEPSIDTRRLFDPNGALRLPEGLSGGRPPPAAQGLPPIRSPVPYRKTRFDEVWVPDGENLGEEVLRKVTLEKEIKTPWGTRWRCAVVLVIGACADVPPPAMKNPPKMPWETYVEEPEAERPLD